MLGIEEHKNNNFTVSRATSTSVDNTLEAVGFASSEKIHILSEPSIMYIKSSSSDDRALSGTGARTIFIEGGRRVGDDEVIPVSEYINLNGTPYVASSFSYSEIYNVRIEEYGSNGTNVGAITVNNLSGASYTPLVTLTASVGKKRNSLLIAPNNMKLKTLNVYINAVDGDKIDFTAVFYEIIVRKITSLATGKYSTLSFDPDASSTPGSEIARYLCSGGATNIEMYDELKTSDILWITARNTTNTDSYTVSTELVLYDI